MSKISVIIPVYNVEAYLRQCIDSVLNQSFKDIEIILIDDGSTDDSGNICDLYCAQDDRIHVIHKKNEGLACARNDGIALASAQYIMFVDSDDWVERDFCIEPYNKAVKNNADIVLFTHNRIYGNGKIVPIRTNMKSGSLSKSEALYYSVTVTNAVWIGIYRKQLFEKIRFPQGKLYEDVGITHRLFYSASNIHLINRFLYNRRVERVGSITNSSDTRNHQDLRVMFMNKIDDLCCWGYDEYAKLCALSIIIEFGWKEFDKEKLIGIIKKSPNNMIYPPISLKHKTLINILLVSPKLFDYLCVLTKKRNRNNE